MLLSGNNCQLNIDVNIKAENGWDSKKYALWNFYKIPVQIKMTIRIILVQFQ